MTNLSEPLDPPAVWKLKGERVPRPVGHCEQQLPLRVKLKGEDNLRWHLIPIADSTRSNIPNEEMGQRTFDKESRWEPATLNLFDPTFP